MASGCIFGECRICHELMWEDEDLSFEHSDIIHKKCYEEIVKLIKIL